MKTPNPNVVPVVTPLEIVIEARLLQSVNTESLIVVIVPGMDTLVRPVQP